MMGPAKRSSAGRTVPASRAFSVCGLFSDMVSPSGCKMEWILVCWVYHKPSSSWIVKRQKHERDLPADGGLCGAGRREQKDPALLRRDRPVPAAYVNEKGYRFYSPFQLDRLALIVTLKDLGVPLKEIGDYLNGGDLARVDQILTRQSRELDRRIAQLTRRRALLETLRRQNRAFLDGCGKGPQRLHREPERIAVLMDRAEMESSRVLIVNYLTDGPGTGLCGEGEERFLY